MFAEQMYLRQVGTSLARFQSLYISTEFSTGLPQLKIPKHAPKSFFFFIQEGGQRGRQGTLPALFVPLWFQNFIRQIILGSGARQKAASCKELEQLLGLNCLVQISIKAKRLDTRIGQLSLMVGQKTWIQERTQ